MTHHSVFIQSNFEKSLTVEEKMTRTFANASLNSLAFLLSWKLLSFYAYLITSYECSQELMYIVDNISFLGMMTGNVQNQFGRL